MKETLPLKSWKLKKLEADRAFYTLVSMYDRYKDYDFPEEIKEIVIVDGVRYIFVGCCAGFKISEFTFGKLLELWKGELNYNGNPIVYSLYYNGGGCIKYWDLETCTVKSERKVFKLDVAKYKSRIRNKNLGKTNDIINFIRKNVP